MSPIKTLAEIERMRVCGKIVAGVLNFMKNSAVEGMTPHKMSLLAAQELKRLGGEPVMVDDFPNIICISVNDQVQHTVPDNRPFEEGDVVNFDFWAQYQGMITDAGLSVGIGKLSADNQRLIDGTRSALNKAIAVVRAGIRVGDISAIIEEQLKSHRLSIVKELMGHGVGHTLHEEPGIPNFGRKGKGPILVEGMTICIEPIASLGSGRIFEASAGSLRRPGSREQ